MASTPYEYKSPYVEVRPDKSERKCLKCGKEFKSAGPGNRICGECGRENVHAYRRDSVSTRNCSGHLSFVAKDS